MTHPWLQINILEKLLQFELYLLISILGLSAYVFYKFLLESVSAERHRSLQRRFRGLLNHFIFLTVAFVIFQGLIQLSDLQIVMRIAPYVGLIVVVSGSLVFVQICRLMILMYFFLLSKGNAVPILLVNIFTLILSLFLAGWIFTGLFGIQVAPLLATSAAFSIILGLALQDTLGNLFAGISLQLDSVFEIGNWVEIIINGQKVVGEIFEITWRSTVMIGFADEVITIPNRVVAQSQISNWTRVDTPVIRSQTFRIAFGADVNLVKMLLRESLLRTSSIRKTPVPLVLVSEVTESWILIKTIYYIDRFGSQYIIADEVISNCMHTLNKANIKLASAILEVQQKAQ